MSRERKTARNGNTERRRPAASARHRPPSGRFGSIAELSEWLTAAAAARLNWGDWHWQMRHSLDAVDLAGMGLLHDEATMRAALQFPVTVTPYYLSLVDWGNPADPVRLQWLPDGRELARLFSDAVDDPFQETRLAPLRGLVHRFPDRVLVLAADQCAMRCRHCTRKNAMAGRGLTPLADSRAALSYVEAHPKVREVILSGGDPLMLPDDRIVALVERFAALPQIDAVRIGTRVPVVLPMRITALLARRLGRSRKVWVNTQFNHERELTPASAQACGRFVDAGIPVSNQSVLLKGVNDSVDAMFALCAGLQRIRVRPYYVFQCDPVSGTLHFRITPGRARAIQRGLASRLGGLALPRFVADVPGAPSKGSI